MWQDSEIARRVDGRIEVRTDNLRLRWEMKDFTTSDGHSVNATFSCTVHGLNDPTEQRMLEEVFLSSRSIATTQDLIDHFAASLYSAGESFAGQTNMESLLSDERRAAFAAHLMKAAGAVAFTCGVEILPPAQLDLGSLTYRNSRRDILAREQAKQAAAEQAERVARNAELFKQFHEIRQSAPELSTAQILSRVGIADQSELIRTLLMKSAEKSRAVQLWAVAGPYLIQVDLREDSPKTKLIPLSPVLGPLRSVQSGEDGKLLIGARSGVMIVDSLKPDGATLYADPEAVSAMGFNQVVSRGNEIWATHADAGLVCWNIADGAKPAKSIRPQDQTVNQFSPHYLAIINGRILVGSGNRLLLINDDTTPHEIQTGQREEIQTILPREKGTLIVYSDGRLGAMDFDGTAAPYFQRRAGRITAAAPIPWVQETRLLLATQDGPIVCAGFDDELLTNYSSVHQSLRIVAASAADVAAVTSDRQRLILWHSWDGRKPAAELHLAGLAKHRIADIAFM